MGLRPLTGTLMAVWVLSNSTLAQPRFGLNSTVDFLPESIFFADSLEFLRTKSLWEKECIEKGYWLFDWRKKPEPPYILLLIEGPQFTISNQSYSKWHNGKLDTVRKLAQNGHAFARFSIDSLRLFDDNILAFNTLQVGSIFTIDSVITKGDFRIPTGFLKHHFGLEIGRVFNENIIRSIETKSRNLNFMGFERKPEILFSNKGTWIYLYPNKRKTNRLDLLLGYNTLNGSGRLSGHADLRLNNLFKGGQWLGLKWQAPPNSVQMLNAELGLPYVLKSRFWLENTINMYRQDSTFLNFHYTGKIRYARSAKQFVGLVYRSESSRTSQSESSSLGNFNKQLWGIDLESDSRNSDFLPTEGALYQLEFSVGNRKIEKNNDRQYRIQALVEQQFHFKTKHILKLNSSFYYLDGLNLKNNELFRLGGEQSIRGFAEQSLFANAFIGTSAEYRFKLDNSTFFSCS